MTPAKSASAAILADIHTRKGFPAFFDTIAPETRERITDAWERLIEEAYAAEA